MPFLVFRRDHLRSTRGSFEVRDHLRSNLGIISGLGIICGRGSFAALYIPRRYLTSDLKLKGQKKKKVCQSSASSNVHVLYNQLGHSDHFS